MIPVRFNEPGHPPAPNTSHYVVARNGLFLCKKEWWVEAVVPVGQKILYAEEPSARLLMPSLKAEILIKALKMMHKIYEVMAKSEVCLLLHYNKETGYQLSVPQQTVSPGRVKYDARQRLPGHICVGTIHSHGEMSAYHSCTDVEDERYWDGVHITLGTMASYPQFSLSAEMIVNGTRFPVDSVWFEGLVMGQYNLFLLDHPTMQDWEVPLEWLTAVSESKIFSLQSLKGEV